MPPESCLAPLRVPVEPAEGQTRGALILPLQRHSFVVGFERGGVGQDGVRPFGIVKRYPSGDDPLGLEAI